MMKRMVDRKIFRIIDANYNRAKEGLRVCEDIYRFYLEDKKTTKKYKEVRHKLTSIITELNVDIIKARDIKGDIGKGSTDIEFHRNNVCDIFYANAQRVKESLRVLEEFCKLINKKTALSLKKIRYEIYNTEKEFIKYIN